MPGEISVLEWARLGLLGLRLGFVPTLFASSRALCEFHLSGLPINLGIVLAKPGVPQDEVPVAEIGDREQDLLTVPLVLEDQVYYFGNLSSFIRTSIDIEDRHRAGQLLRRKLIASDEVLVNEGSGGATVY